MTERNQSSGPRWTIVELGHPIRDGMVTYPGLPGPAIGTHLSREASRERYAPGTEFFIGTISMVANAGTYVDVPFHRFADGADLADMEASKFAYLPGLVIRAGERTAIDGVPNEGFELTALHAPVEGLGSFPVRVVARIPAPT